MRALIVRLRAEARASWRAWVGLALLLGVAGGVAAASAAGARRTSTAYPRLLEWSRAAHFMTGGGPDSIDLPRAFREISARPEVAETATTMVVSFRMRIPRARGDETIVEVPESLAATDPEGEFGTTFNRIKMLEGRQPDRRTPEEASLPFVLADRYGVGVGDRITLVLGNPFGGPQKDVSVRLVGVHAAPGEFPGVGTLSLPAVWVSPAIAERYRELMPPPESSDANTLHVRLHDERRGFASFRRWFDASPHAELDIPFIQRDQAAGTQRSMSIYEVTLWVAAALVGVTGIAVYAQALGRQLFLDSRDHPTLRALGMSRSNLVALCIARAGVVSVVAACLAVAVAAALSPVFPIGFARAAEPYPGVRADGLVLGSGAIAVVVLAMAVAVWPAFRWSRPREEAIRDRRVSTIASTAQRWGLPPAPLAGLRLALEPGRGATATPVRSTIGGVSIAIAAFTAAIVTAASFDHLLGTPALAGQTYDAIVGDDDEGGAAEGGRAEIASHPAIAEVAAGTVTNGRLGGVDMFGVVFEQGAPIGFASIEGRTPTDAVHDGRSEIALGVRTMRRMGLAIGDHVSIEVEGHGTAPDAIEGTFVGTVAIPVFPFGATQPGEGFALTLSALRRTVPDTDGCCFVRFRPGVDRDDVLQQFARRGFFALRSTERSDLVTLEQVSGAPLALAGVFAAIAVAVMAHALTTGIRRRRRDLAILKTLGFVRRQARAAVAWQATVTVLVCLLIALPAGFALGRWGWRFFAYGFGVVPVPVVPTAFLVLVVPVTILVANVIAVGPARAAARTQPAVVLRAPD